jgi:hypothetical protein
LANLGRRFSALEAQRVRGLATLGDMDTSAYTVEISFVDRSSNVAISGEPLRLQAGTPIPDVDDSLYLTETDTDYSHWVVKSRDFMYLTPEVQRGVMNLRITILCDRRD